jgi:hypothetical protein
MGGPPSSYAAAGMALAFDKVEGNTMEEGKALHPYQI